MPGLSIATLLITATALGGGVFLVIGSDTFAEAAGDAKAASQRQARLAPLFRDCKGAPSFWGATQCSQISSQISSPICHR